MDSDTDTDTSLSFEEEGDDPWEDAGGLYMEIGNHGVHMRGPGQMLEVNLGGGIRMVTTAGAQVNEIRVDHRGVHLGAGAQVNGVRVNVQTAGVRQGRVQRRDHLRQRRSRLELCRRCGSIHRAGACTGSRPVAEHHKGNRECSICLEAVGAAGRDDVVLLCGHAFHYDCVAPRCRRKPTCPVCRSQLEQPD